MPRSLGLIFLLIVFFVGHGSALAAQRFGVGLGLESRLQQSANPNELSIKNRGQLFLVRDFLPWSVLLDVANEKAESSAGTLQVRQDVWTSNIWGRARFWGNEFWSTYAAAGLGVSFEKVRTRVFTEEDSRWGRRLRTGTGVGLSARIRKVAFAEAEVRVAGEELRREPLWGAALRLGFNF